MKVAVSNIAWSPVDRKRAYAILQERGIRGLEIAPGLFFSEGAGCIRTHRGGKRGRPCPACSMPGSNWFRCSRFCSASRAPNYSGRLQGANGSEAAMLRAIRLAGRFAIPNLVFGSPTQRIIPEGMSIAHAQDIAIDMFQRLGEHATKANCRIAIEPNPTAYNTNFLNRVSEALAFVEAVNHPGISLNLDIGAMHMNGDFDQLGTIAHRVGLVASHVHFSEPFLGPAPACIKQAEHVLSIMSQSGYSGWYSIEMKTPTEAPLEALERSVDKLCAAVERL